MNIYSKLNIISEVEDYFNNNEDYLTNALDTLLNIRKDGVQYEIHSRFNELELRDIRGNSIPIEEYPKAVYRLARLLALLNYGHSEGETTYFILDIFFNKDNDGEDVSFITLCQDVSATVGWISETYGYEANEANVLDLISMLKHLHLEFSRLI